eukprot:TRINITY_DN3495_c0_g1_i4.p1 TRINITY_DN3495_c0_g1~~TRINITY_DN3495_c0_g1_i4.p1  ORF type:complete len:216 (+),score=48.21 TRINITY_DN3495_c0_g1_i4:56-703(+)
MRSMRVFVCVFFVAVVAVSQTHALYFLLEEGQQQCFMEELAEGIPAIVEFQLSHEAQATGIDVEILGPDDGPVALSKGNDGSIAFTSTMGGDYTICFHSRSTSWFGSVTNLKVIFNIKTNEDAIDYDEIAKADHLDSIEVSIRRLHDKIRGIRHEQEYMKVHYTILTSHTDSSFFASPSRQHFLVLHLRTIPYLHRTQRDTFSLASIFSLLSRLD